MPSASEMKSVVVTGATGMIGGLVLRLSLERADVRRVVSVGRRSTGLAHDKLEEILLDDFEDSDSLGPPLEGHDAALFCMGAYTGVVPNDELRRLTTEAPLQFAEALIVRSPSARFGLLSGQGADRSERSRMVFARAKGAAEQGLIELGFPAVLSFRPGYIYPVTPRREPNVSYRIFRALYPVLGRLVPNVGVPSDALARVMVEETIGASGGGDRIFENRDIRRLAGV